LLGLTVEAGANNMQTFFDWLVAATFGIALGFALFFGFFL